MKMIYEGKAKTIYEAQDPAMVIIDYKDDATAFNGGKKGEIRGKGEINKKISTTLFHLLQERGIATHLIESTGQTTQLCHKVRIFPLEVIVRNVIAGSMAARLGIEEGTEVRTPIEEICYKNDDFGDPLINDHHAIAMGLATKVELKEIYEMTREINKILITFFKEQGIRLIDFKLEFGKKSDGTIVLADEISPDTCRLWDIKTGEKLDKDRFRRDMGGIEEAYKEILDRVESL